ncbi:MAG: ketoacyl-ACP synthase III [Bacteroidales bacterium]|nr:ketoacyl-ACP synthase III [Bacteroidales bacterium]
MKRNAFIHSSGIYVPERVIPNSYFNTLLGEDVDSWLRENVEIYERRWCSENQSVADLVIEAAGKAMTAGNVKPEEIDLLIISTDTPEYISPSTASKVQYKLGLVNAGSFDVNTACAGFVTALDMGAKYIRADEHYNTVMVVGAYAMSKYLNMKNKNTVTLFADGAGAFILKTTEDKNRGFLASQLITRGEFYDYMGIYGGGTNQPITDEVIINKGHLLQFVKKFPKTLNPEMWSMMSLTLCNRLGITPDKVDHYFLTQININSIRETMDILGQRHQKAQTSMHYFGYTGSACIPLAFQERLDAGKIQRGDLVFFIGSGGGLAFASAAFRY